MKSIAIQFVAWLIALSTIFYYYKKADHALVENSRLTVNNKSLERGMLTFKDDSSRTHTLTIEQQKTLAELKYSSDSNTIALLNRVQQYKIKLKDVKSLQTIKTVIQHDTVVQYTPGLDTTYDLSQRPHLEHTITLKGKELKDHLKITNSQDVIMKGTKETIEPPKKFFLWRWFQKKHIVVTGEVINSNPLIDVTQQTFIKPLDVK